MKRRGNAFRAIIMPQTKGSESNMKKLNHAICLLAYLAMTAFRGTEKEEEESIL